MEVVIPDRLVVRPLTEKGHEDHSDLAVQNRCGRHIASHDKDLVVLLLVSGKIAAFSLGLEHPCDAVRGGPGHGTKARIAQLNDDTVDIQRERIVSPCIRTVPAVELEKIELDQCVLLVRADIVRLGWQFCIVVDVVPAKEIAKTRNIARLGVGPSFVGPHTIAVAKRLEGELLAGLTGHHLGYSTLADADVVDSKRLVVDVFDEVFSTGSPLALLVSAPQSVVVLSGTSGKTSFHTF